MITEQEETGRAGAPADGGANRALQHRVIPRKAPRVPGYDIAAGTGFERRGGATAWTRLELAGGRAGLAALVARGADALPAHPVAVAAALLRAFAPETEQPGEVLARVNDALSGRALEAEGVAVECGLLLVGSGGVDWSGAGAVPGAVLGRNGTLEELPSHGPPLGVLPGFAYGSRRLDVGTGDTVLVLSEGTQGLFRGAADLVASLHGKPAGEVVSTLLRAVRKAQGDAPVETSILFARRT